MRELRKDRITDDWIIVASGRNERPNEFESPTVRRSDAVCPFCLGSENLTPDPIASYRLPDSSVAWNVRVFPNLYPVTVSPTEAGGSPQSSWESSATEAVGHHEVIVESARHIVSPVEQQEREHELVFQVYRDRLRALAKLPYVRHALLFKNSGPRAGASIEHAHSQIIALPRLPVRLANELAASRVLFEQRGQCPFCELIAEESQSARRMVLATDTMIAFCPFASRVPFEMCVLPKNHLSRFETAPEPLLQEASQVVRQCLQRLWRSVGPRDFNLVLHSAPFDSSPYHHYHWHIEILPRLTTQAGFEWGTGVYINPTSPEYAADQLRRA